MTPLLHATQLYLGVITSVDPTKTLTYTVPSGDRVILRSVAVRNGSGSTAVQTYIYLNTVRIWSTALAGGGNFEWRPWLVLNPGDQINASVSAAAGASFAISGSVYYI